MGFKILLDAQLNHTADFLSAPGYRYTSADRQPPPPFNDPDWYHHCPNIENFADPIERQNGSLGGLDNLAQENPACRQALLTAYGSRINKKGWLGIGFAGARIDTALEIPPRFLADFERATNCRCFGEAYTSDVRETATIQRFLWSVLDFPLILR